MAEERIGGGRRGNPASQSMLVTPEQMEELSVAFDTVGSRG